MKRTVFVSAIAMALLSLVSAQTVKTAWAADEEIKLKVSNWFPIGHQQNTLLQEWCKDLEKRSAGKVKVNYYAGGTLVPAAQSYDAVVKGIVDVSNHVLGYTMGRFPFSQALDMPIGLPTGAATTEIVNLFYEKFHSKEFEDVKVLWFHCMPPGYVHTKSKPVNTLEDMKGLKLRCYGSNAQFVSNMGAAPVAMPMPEVYDALAKGVVDGLLSSYEALEGFRTGEHVKYSTENLRTGFGATFVVMMNKKTFASLTPDIQAILDQMSKEYVVRYGKMWAEINAKGKDWLIKRGVKMIPLDQAEETRWYEKGSKPVVDAYIKDMKEKGLPGAEAISFLFEMSKKYGK